MDKIESESFEKIVQLVEEIRYLIHKGNTCDRDSFQFEPTGRCNHGQMRYVPTGKVV